MNYNDIMKMPGRKIKPKVYYYEGSNKIELLKDDIILAKPFFNASLVGTIMKGLELELTSVLPNKPIYFENTAKYGSNSATKTIGPYYLKEEPTFNADSKTYTHKLYDDFIKSMVPYKPITITYPCSLIDFFKRLCVECNFTTNITSLPNGQRIIDHDIYDGLDFTYRDVFEDIGQATATLFKNNSGNVEKCSLGASNIIIDDDILRNQNISLGEHFGPINSIVLSRAGESDSIYKRDESLTTWNEFKIVDNILMNDNNRSDYLDDLYTALSGLEYDIFDLELVGFGGFEPLQKISIKTNNKTYNSYVFNNEEKYTQGYEESIYTELPAETVTDYNASDKTDKRINQVYVIANKQEKRIDAVVSEQKQIEKDIITSKTASSNPIEVTDAGEYPLESIGIDDKSYQETTTGKNKFIIPSNSTSNGVVLTNNDDGSFNLHGTATAKADFLIFKAIEDLDFKFGNAYTLSSNYNATLFSIWVQEYDASNWVSVGMYLDGGRKNVSSTIVKNPNAKVIAFQISIPNGTTINLDNIKVQLEEGQAATDIESYTGGIPSPNPKYPSKIKTVQGITNYFTLGIEETSNIGISAIFNKSEFILDGTTNAAGNILSKRDNIGPNGYRYIGHFKAGTYYINSTKISGDFTVPGGSFAMYFRKSDNTTVFTISKNLSGSQLITLTEETDLFLQIYANASGIIFNKYKVQIQIESGNKANRYVPYGRWLEQITYSNLYDGSQNIRVSSNMTRRDFYGLKEGYEYTLSFKKSRIPNASISNGTVNLFFIAYFDKNNNVITNWIAPLAARVLPVNSSTDVEYTFTIPNNCYKVSIRLDNNNSDTNINTLVSEIMLNGGDKALPYQECKENTALIDMNKPNEFDKEDFLQGTLNTNSSIRIIKFIKKVLKGETYTIVNNNSSLGFATGVYSIGTQGSGTVTNDSGWKDDTYTLTSGQDGWLYLLVKKSDDTEILPNSLNNADFIVYEGYEPYYEFAGTDEIKDDFLDGDLTANIQKLILTGNENFGAWGEPGGFSVNLGLKAKYIASNMSIPNAKCTHFIADGRLNVYNDTSDNIFSINDTTIYIRYNKYTKSADFKAFLKEQYDAGTPVEIYYELEIPKIYKLNYEPLKLHKGYNYITLNDDLCPNMKIKYLTDSKFNADFVTHAQFSIESDKIESSLRGKVSSDELNETITEVTNDFTQKISESEASTESKITVATNNAINTSENYTNAQLANRPTKTEMTSAITQSANATEAKAEILVQQKIEDIQIGGTNLGRKGCISPYNSNGNTTVNNTNFDKNGSAVITRKAFMNEGPMLDRYVRYEVGQKYVISFEFKTSTATVTSFNIHNGTNATNTEVYVDGILKGNFGQQIPFTPNGNFHKIELRFKAGNNQNPEVLDTNHIIFQPDKLNSRAYTAELRYFKIEKGNKATDWSPAPEDMATNSNVEAKLELYVGKDDNDQVVSMFNASADIVEVKADRFILDSTHNKIAKNGTQRIISTDTAADSLAFFSVERPSQNEICTIKPFEIQIKGYENAVARLFTSLGHAVLYLSSQKSNKHTNITSSMIESIDDATNEKTSILPNKITIAGKQAITGTYGNDNDVTSFAIVGSDPGYLEFSTIGKGAYGVNIWASDKRLKRRVKDSKYNALDTLMKIKHRQFIYRKSNEKVLIGYVADELQEIDENMIFEVGPQKIKQPNSSYIIPILSKAIQEQQEIIESQNKRITELEGKVNKLLELIEGKNEE